MNNLRTWVHVFNDGLNVPRDSGPNPRPPFTLDADSAKELDENFSKHGSPLAVDYEHLAWNLTEPAPFPDRFERAGKIVKTQYRPGRGYYLLTEFTDRATRLIKNSEGAYFSAVVHIDPKTNKPKQLFGAGLTQNPAINLEEIQAFSVRLTSADGAVFSSPVDLNSGNQATDTEATAGDPPAGEKHMSENLKKIAVLLGAENETDPEKLADKAISFLEAATVAKDMIASAAGLDPKVATLSEIGSAVKSKLAAEPDATKYVKLEAFAAANAEKDTLAGKVAELEKKILAFEAEKAVSAYMTGDVKITPSMKAFAIDLFCESKEKFDKYVSTLPVQTLSGKPLISGNPQPDKPTEGKSFAALAKKVDPTIKLASEANS